MLSKILWATTALTLHALLGAFCKEPNNVCSTIEAYENVLNSPKCWYDPNVEASEYELLTINGYPMEIYQTITEDGYIITVVRIPPKNKHSRDRVLLEHSSIASGTVFADIGNESFAFLLHEAGYDVWLGNFRGTVYSQYHVCLSPYMNPYWNFSFHEFAIYDIPAQIQLIRQVTKTSEKIYMVGYSVGTTAGFAYASLLSEHAQRNVQLYINFAPIATTKDGTSMVQLMSPFANEILEIGEAAHQLDVVPYYSALHYLIKFICAKLAVTMPLCVTVTRLIAGTDEQHFAPERLPTLVSQHFAGYPLKGLVHYSQIYNARGRFQEYDYGVLLNKVYYNSELPPLYPLDKIEVPMYFAYGSHDILAEKHDARFLYSCLPEKARYGIREVQDYDHLSFAFARNVSTTLYLPTIKIMDENKRRRKLHRKL